jgi:hypothetical protein
MAIGQMKLAGSSYYKQIDGKKYDRKALQIAKTFNKKGGISLKQQGNVASAVLDGASKKKGGKLTQIERDTVALIRKEAYLRGGGEHLERRMRSAGQLRRHAAEKA